MSADLDKQELLDAGVEDLTRRLPANWAVEKQPSAWDPQVADLVLKTPNSENQSLIFVEVKANVSPRDGEGLMGGPWRRRRRQMGNQPILLVAPYISPRVRDLLTQENVSYIDLTGNIRISLDYPGVFIETQGASAGPRSSRPRIGTR
jgi:hypothetical protein